MEHLEYPKNTLSHAVETELHLFPDFHKTDMQYNIGQIEGDDNPISLDIIDTNSHKRLLVTYPSSPISEMIIRTKLKDHPILTKKRSFESGTNTFEIYSIPKDTKLAVKMLKQPPYIDQYMRDYAWMLGTFMRDVYNADSNLLGLNIDRIAFAENDDHEISSGVHFILVPPFMDPVDNKAASIESKALDFSRFLDDFDVDPKLTKVVIDSFLKGA